MTIRHLLGYVLIASPFVTLGLIMLWIGEFRTFLIALASAALIVAVLLAGFSLVTT